MNKLNKSVFSSTPDIKLQRSIFDKSYSHKTTFNSGDLIPLHVEEVLPGSTYNFSSSFLLRSTTPLVPVMDSAYFDVYSFFVPNRLLMDKWEKVVGSTDNLQEWENGVKVSVPQVFFGEVKENTLPNYIGVPVGKSPTGVPSTVGVSVLPFKAYQKIYNDWFRANAIQQSIFLDSGNLNNLSFNTANDYLNSTIFQLRRANRYKDYFSTCTPQPQQGESVQLSGDFHLPVLAQELSHDSNLLTYPEKFYDITAGAFETTGYTLHSGDGGGSGASKLNGSPDSGSFSPNRHFLTPSNLYAKESNVPLFDMNQFYFADALQKFLVNQANFGTRYTELLYGHFGVVNPDSRLQRSELLGSGHHLLNQQQVAQTSSSTSTSPLGETGAFSLTAHTADGSFSKSFSEHGFIITIGVVRVAHSYQQGLSRYLTRHNMFDFYFPEFSNIGHTPVLSSELFFWDSPQNQYSIFGYNEAWADLRERQNMVTGTLSSACPQPLDFWHYADYYQNKPGLVSSFLEELPSFFDRTLAVKSSHLPQFKIDFYVNQSVTLPLPVTSVPGLKDIY
jgi:hypothetical protein